MDPDTTFHRIGLQRKPFLYFPGSHQLCIDLKTLKVYDRIQVRDNEMNIKEIYIFFLEKNHGLLAKMQNASIILVTYFTHLLTHLSDVFVLSFL